MRILFIAGADQKYGSYHISRSLLFELHKFNQNVVPIVITQRFGPLNEWCNENDIENYVLPYRYCVYYPTQNRIKRLLKLIYKKITITASNLLALYKIKQLGIMDNIDIIHTNINRDLFGMLLARKYKIPNITHLREYSRAHFKLKPIYRNQKEIMNQYSAKFIAISNAVKKDWVEYGLDAEKISVIYDGIDTASYSPNSNVNDHDDLKITMCGAIYEGKGQLELIKAVEPLIQSGLHITVDLYGDRTNDGYDSRIMSFIEEHGIGSNIHIKGVSHDLPRQLPAYDVGVICSKAEGFGLVTIEYLLSGLLVIASNTGANPELLKNGKYGYLYNLGDIEQLREIIQEIYLERDLLIEKRDMAIEYVKSTFGIKDTVKKITDMYFCILKEK